MTSDFQSHAFMVISIMYCLHTMLINCTYVVKCQELSKFDNGNVNCSLGDDGVHSYQDNCSITCNEGYILTGDETKTCQSDGSWSGIDAMCKRGINS